MESEDFIDSMAYSRLGDFAMDTLDSDMVVNNNEKCCELKTKGKKPVDPHVTCVVNKLSGY